MALPGIEVTAVLLSAVAVITASICWVAVEFFRKTAEVTKKRIGYEHKQAMKQMKHKRQHVEEVFEADKAEAETPNEVTIVVPDRAVSSDDSEADDDQLE
jgi:mannitol-specific phosphotransferase system IIBC component